MLANGLIFLQAYARLVGFAYARRAHRADVFVPLNVVRRAANHDDVRAAIAVHIGDLATGGGHGEMIEFLVMPISAGLVGRVENVGGGDFAPGAITRNDLISAVAVEVAHADLVAFGELVIDDVTVPAALAVFGVNDNFVAVPRLNCRENAVLAKMGNFDVARAQSRRFLRVMPLDDHFFIPLQVVAF